MTKASRQLLFTIVASFGLAGLAGLASIARPVRMELGSPTIGGPFAMIAHDGRTVTNGDLEGRPYLVFFGYTHCPGFCPATLLAISEVFKAMGPDKRSPPSSLLSIQRAIRRRL